MNEPAFPGFDYINQNGKKNPEGMTLRDYFAAKVIEVCVNHTSTLTRAAEEAYKIADAMLKEREL